MKDSDPIDLETEDLSEEEFNLLTLNCAFEDDESEDKIWEKYLTSESSR